MKATPKHSTATIEDGGKEPAPLDLLNRRNFSPRLSAGEKFWQFKNLANNTAELLLYGEIKSEKSWMDDWFGGSVVYADEFVQDLRNLGNVSQITCRVNSVGGDIFAAIAIYTQLKTHAARIVCIVDGLAASAATLPLMAADETQMPIGAMLMIHDPLACLCGIYNADELAKNMDTLNTIKESIVAIYADRTGQKEADIAAMMNAEKWMTTAEAVELGFCDTQIAARIDNIEMKGKVLFMNKVEHDLSQFKNVPPGLEHAENILDTIAAHNAGSDIVTEFVALAKKNDKPDPDETDNPDQDPETPEDDKKDKKNKKNTTKKDADETIDDDDADADEDEDCKDKKAKNATQRLINRYPKLVNRIVAEAKAEERQRIQGIEDLTGQVDPKMAKKAKFEAPEMTASDLALAQMQLSQGRASKFLATFEQDTNESGAKKVGAAANAFADQSADEQRAGAGELIASFANKILNRGGKR